MASGAASVAGSSKNPAGSGQGHHQDSEALRACHQHGPQMQAEMVAADKDRPIPGYVILT